MLSLTISGIIALLKSCFLMFGYIQSSQLFPEPLAPEEEKIFLERLSNRWWRSQKYSYWEKLKTCSTYF